MSDSGTDSDDEVQIKKYFNNDLLSALQQAKHKQESKGGIKRAPGHHLLRNKKQAVIEKKKNTYNGQHWDVDCDNGLERATRRMTIHAVNSEISKEQLRRVKDEKETFEQASANLYKINLEFWKNLEQSQRRQRIEEMEQDRNRQLQKTKVQNQLIQKYKAKKIAEETEIEKARQLKLLTSIKDKVARTNSEEDLLRAFAENNRKKSIVHTDLLEAFIKFEEGESDVDKQYKTAMSEIMDESLNCIRQMFHRQKARVTFLEERERRVKHLRDLMKEREYQINMQNYNVVMSNLRGAFKKVQKREKEIERECRRLAEERRIMVQEQLTRKVAMKWADQAFAKERHRQLNECAEQAGKSDPYRDAVKFALAKVQREMILQKFNGKWVDQRNKSKNASTSSESVKESEQDRRLKEIRLKSRRKSYVIREEDE